MLFRSPETIFADAHSNKATDIWTLGCTIYELMGERSLFEGFAWDRDFVVAEHVSALEKPPQHLWELGTAEKFISMRTVPGKSVGGTMPSLGRWRQGSTTMAENWAQIIAKTIRTGYWSY